MKNSEKSIGRSVIIKYLVPITMISSSIYLSFVVISFGLFFISQEKGFDRIFFPDRELGYSLNPSYAGNINSRAKSVPAMINSQGFRGPEWETESDRQKLMFVGDSFTFGIPHEYEIGFVAKVGKKLRNSSVYNLGVPGYDIAHNVGVIKKYCRRIKPAYVFYMYFYNDISDIGLSVRNTKSVDGVLVPRFKSDGNEYSQEEIAASIDKATQRRLKLSDLLKLVYLRTFLAERGVHPRQIVEAFTGKTDIERYMGSLRSGYSAKNAAKAVQVLNQMVSESRDCGARFVMVILPSNMEAFYGFREPITKKFLQEIEISKSQFDIIDTAEFMPKGQRVDQWYDGHYSELGTEIVSDAIAKFVEKRQ